MAYFQHNCFKFLNKRGEKFLIWPTNEKVIPPVIKNFSCLVFVREQIVPVGIEFILHPLDVVGHVGIVVEEAHLRDGGVLGDHHESEHNAVNLGDLRKYNFRN